MADDTVVVWDEALLTYDMGDHPLDPVRVELTMALARELTGAAGMLVGAGPQGTLAGRARSAPMHKPPIGDQFPDVDPIWEFGWRFSPALTIGVVSLGAKPSLSVSAPSSSVAAWATTRGSGAAGTELEAAGGGMPSTARSSARISFAVV